MDTDMLQWVVESRFTAAGDVKRCASQQRRNLCQVESGGEDM